MSARVARVPGPKWHTRNIFLNKLVPFPHLSLFSLSMMPSCFSNQLLLNPYKCRAVNGGRILQRPTWSVMTFCRTCTVQAPPSAAPSSGKLSTQPAGRGEVRDGAHPPPPSATTVPDLRGGWRHGSRQRERQEEARV